MLKFMCFICKVSYFYITLRDKFTIKLMVLKCLLDLDETSKWHVTYCHNFFVGCHLSFILCKVFHISFLFFWNHWAKWTFEFIRMFVGRSSTKYSFSLIWKATWLPDSILWLVEISQIFSANNSRIPTWPTTCFVNQISKMASTLRHTGIFTLYIMGKKEI